MSCNRLAGDVGRGAAVLATVMAVVLASPAVASSGQSGAGPHLRERQILSIALAAAGMSGDPRPTLIQHGVGTRAKANFIASGAGVPGNRRSYLIAERGRFVLNNASIPPGATVPSGRVLTLVVEVATGQVTDFGVSNRYPNLAALSSVTTDLRSAPVTTGVLTGAIRLIGGAPPLRPNIRRAGDLTVSTFTGQPVAHEHVRSGHSFRLRLPPGRYAIRDATRWACAASTAVVRAGHVTRVEVDYGCGAP